jgi:hypothetical protein
MSLTVGGFAPPREVRLRGKGGNGGRQDNGVSPPPGTRGGSSANAATSLPQASVDAGRKAPSRRAAAPSQGRGTGVARNRKRAAPAAVEWRDSRLPIVGRLLAKFWLLAVLFAGCLVALMYLLQASGVATSGYDIQRLQTERSDWQLRNQQLQLELAKRRSLTWIEAEATGRLGMVRAEPTALAYVTVRR